MCHQLKKLPPPVDAMCSSIGHVAGCGDVCEELPLISLGETLPPAQDEFMFNMLPTTLEMKHRKYNINHLALYKSSKFVTNYNSNLTPFTADSSME